MSDRLTRRTETKTWRADRAALVLDRARHATASGQGMSDRTLGRIAALSSNDAALTRASFTNALKQAGWGRKRISKAVAEVEQSLVLRPVRRAFNRWIVDVDDMMSRAYLPIAICAALCGWTVLITVAVVRILVWVLATSAERRSRR